MLPSRADLWTAERFEKAERLTDQGVGVVERTVRAVENSVETGWLGLHVLGEPMYFWILLLAGLLLLGLFVRRRQTRHVATILLVLCVGIAAAQEADQSTLYPDDPLRVDPDTLGFPAPAPAALSEAYDFVVTSSGWTHSYAGPAVNVNTLGDVPASSWFADRHVRHPLSPEEIRAGVDRGGGPDSTSAWMVVSLDRDGKSVGMEIVDASGWRFVLKLDLAGFPEISTGAEVVSSRILHGIGYHVPETDLVSFTVDDLRPGRAGIDRDAIEAALAPAHRNADGSYRALVSRYVEGRPLGAFRYYGTRSDDANDVFPHELRRELRGLRIIAAWINHTDARAENTLSTVVDTEGGAFVRHYLIDFGTTLGGSPVGTQRPWAGSEYWLDLTGAVRRILPADSPLISDIPGVGRFGGGAFDPESWVPFQPNPAFRRMDRADAFWAAARIAAWSEEDVHAAVQAGSYSDPRATNRITAVLMQRRRAILTAYLRFGGGLDRFRIVDDSLHFVDLPAATGTTDGSVDRRIRWVDTGVETRLDGAAAAIPMGAHLAEIATAGMGRTRVYVRESQVVGVERCAEDGFCSRLADTQRMRRRVFVEGR